VQTKVVHLIIIHIEKDQKSIFFPKNHEKSTFYLKAVKTGTLKAQVGAGAGSGARAGAETF
jgi:hypothetical protein